MIPWFLLLKFLPPLITALMVIVLTWIERKQKSRFFLWGTNVFAIILLIPTSIILYKDHQVSADVDRERAKLTTMMQKSLALQGDEELYKIFVESQRELINRIASKNSDEFIDEFFYTYDKNLERRQNLNQASKKLATKYKIKLEPLKTFILSELDQRMESLIQKEKVSKIEKSDFEAVVIDKNPGFKTLRKYLLKDGYRLIVRMNPLRIDAGQLRVGFNLELKLQRTRTTDDRIFEVNSSNDHTKLFPSRSIFGIHEFSTNKGPMEDKEFTGKLVDAINKAVQYAVIESDVSE